MNFVHGSFYIDLTNINKKNYHKIISQFIMNEEIDVLGFNPKDLKVLQEPEEQGSSNGSENMYRPKPQDSKDKDGWYRSTIKVIYNPFDLKDSVVETQTYAMEDAEGWFMAVSKLTDNDTNCPIFKAWKSYHFSQDPQKKKIGDTKENGGPGYFDKRFGRYVTIQVIKDKNHPELENKYMIWKMPKAIWDKVNSKMNPSTESNKPQIPVMDFLFGRPIDLEIQPGVDDPQHPERKNREIKYTTSEISDDIVACTTPDGKSILNAAEQAVLDAYVEKMSKVWKSKDPEERAALMTEVNADPNTAELKKIYRTVIETLKGFCPNVRAEVGYKPWGEALTKRVEAYLNAIANGQDPKTLGTAPTVADTVGTTPATDAKVTEVPVSTAAPTAAPASSEEEDLPF